MGSGVLWPALVVLWFVVLVPMVVTAVTLGGRSTWADAGGRCSGGGRSTPPFRRDRAVSIDRAALLTSVSCGSTSRRPRATLAGLVALTLLRWWAR
jgi:hypothetical protein